MRHLNRYLDLQQTRACITAPVEAGTGVITVIPCMHEPAMLELLDHLRSCDMPDCPVEIIIVVNHPAGADEAVRHCNRQTLAAIKIWQQHYNNPAFAVHAMDACELPQKKSGVGIARKLGMDEAMLRFASINRPDGVIASLDADCRVSVNYFTGLWQAFNTHPSWHAATIAYSHRLQELTDPRHRLAMICYELYLRYIELGWRYAGLPYAFTAIGSCFAVRANACARHHGMNKRQAGEDFYFLHKLAREQPLAHLDTICVYPSARMSSRTPFGTGQAVADFYHSNQQHWMVCDPSAFDELEQLTESLNQLFISDTATWLASLPAGLRDYLLESGIEQAVINMRGNATTTESFGKRFYCWFDGLKAWRYVNRQASVAIETATCSLLRRNGISPSADNVEALLQQLREQSP